MIFSEYDCHTPRQESSSEKTKKIIESIKSLDYSFLKNNFDIVIRKGKVHFINLSEHKIAAPEVLMQAYTEIHQELQSNPVKLKNPGLLLIGEVHSHVSPKKFLIENMEKLASHGYKILYLEHLLYDQHKNINDENVIQWLSDVNNGHMSHDEEIQFVERFNFLTLVKKAHECGFKVIPLDCSYSYAIENPFNSFDRNDRQVAFTAHAFSVIKNTQGSDKALALIGNTHLFTYKQALGLADLFQASSLYVNDYQSHVSSDIFEIHPHRKPDEQLLPGPELIMSPNYKNPNYEELIKEILKEPPYPKLKNK